MFRTSRSAARPAARLATGLAVLATTALLSAAPAGAEERPCGQPATDATYRTEITEAVTRTVPEQGHWSTVVLVPAVITVEDEYVHQVTGKVRWERADWGAQNGNGRGWVKTGASREAEASPAVTEQRWVVDVPAHDEIVSARTEEQVLVTPALEATEDCAVEAPATEEPVTEGPRNEEPATEEPATEEPGTEEPGTEEPGTAIISDGGPRVDDEGNVVIDDGGPTDEPREGGDSSVASPTSGGQASNQASGQASGQAAPAAGTTTRPGQAASALPNTGGVAGWMAPTGLGALLVGGAAAIGARRRRA